MARKTGKSVSFDAMVKFFMRNYSVPTTKDIDRLLAKMDRLENLIKTALSTEKNRQITGKNAVKTETTSSRSAKTASGEVLNIIKRFKQGIGFAEIKKRTGFEEKKLRNIIFRLDKIGTIKRKSRGLYIVQ